MGGPALALAVGAAAIGGLLLAPFVRPTVFFALAVGGSVVSGFTDQLGIPIGPDRLLLVAAMASLLVGVAEPERHPGTRRLRSVDVALLVVTTVGIASAIAVDTIGDQVAYFGLLDKLGIVPFLGFVLADRLFGTERDRLVLLRVLVGVGAYLAVTAIAEATGTDALVHPRYILDPDVGTHFGRARGPFAEAVGNGLALFACGAAAVVGARVFATRLARAGALAVAVGCSVGVLATVTRAAWLGAVVGTVVGLALDPRSRRRLPAVLVGGVAVVLVSFALIPGLSSRAEARTEDELPVWDRLNTNAAAVRIVGDHPIFGVGWNRFTAVNPDYLRQADYPLTGANIGVHNVLLSYASELGLVGGGCWVLAVGLGLRAAWRGGRHLPPHWRAAAMAVAADWLVVGLFGPLAYAFPNLCVWLWLGLAAAPAARRAEAEQPPAALAGVAIAA